MNYAAMLIGALHSWRIRQLEKKIGYHIEFSHIPNTWINGLVRRNIGPSWKKHGINALGVNHWTIGAIKNGISSRYDRESKQYQSWIGAYLVKFKDDSIFAAQNHFDLAIADQKNWLKVFGDKNPCMSMSEKSISNSKPIKIGGYLGKILTFSGGKSHSDVGSRSNNLVSKIIMIFMSILFKRSTPSLHINYKNLLPIDNNTNYEAVILKGYIAIIPLDKNTYAVLYGNGTMIFNKNKTKDYTPELKTDILKAFSSVKITPLN